MLIMMIRTLILYLIVLLVIRIMGKREIGQLQPFEVVVAILIADLVAVPMTNTGVPIFYGIIPVLSLLVAHLAISQLSLKSTLFRRVIGGSPCIIIANGKIDENMMKKLRYNLDDLFEQLRSNDIFSINDVDYAILETSGNVSLLLKSYKRSLVPKDVGITPGNVWIPRNIIIDGVIDKNELFLSGLTVKELKSELKELKHNDYRDIFLCTTLGHNKFFIQTKSKGRIKTH